MSDTSFRDLTAAVRKLRIQIDNLHTNVMTEQQMIRARASLSLGMLANGEQVHWVHQSRALMQDVESFKRVQMLKSLTEIAASLAESLNARKLRAGLRILQKGRPELVNDDVLELIANSK